VLVGETMRKPPSGPKEPVNGGGVADVEGLGIAVGVSRGEGEGDGETIVGDESRDVGVGATGLVGSV